MAQSPDASAAYWPATAPETRFPTLDHDMDCDVAVIGGGMVGITTARLLKDAGLRVVVIERHRVGRQVTGKSTAKVTTQHHLIYHDLTRRFGTDTARTYAVANTYGLETICGLAERFSIDCDLEEVAGYVYARTDEDRDAVQQEVEAARALGLPAAFDDAPPLPHPTAGAVRFDGQRQFHPCKYVAGLAETIPGDGSAVFENSVVHFVDGPVVEVEGGRVRARHIVMATHLPLSLTGGFFARAYPSLHPSIAAPVDPARAPGAMMMPATPPTRSVRVHHGPNGPVLIAVGDSCEPGMADQDRAAIADLEAYVREHFGVREITHRWTNEDYRSADGLPYVGPAAWSRGETLLTATGFGAWGLTNGTAAARMLTDRILGRENPWAAAFDSRRLKPVEGGGTFLHENTKTAKEMLHGYIARRPHDPERLHIGDGAVFKIDGERVAVHRDDGGQLHMVSAVCSHMGCIVGWNPTDRSWDCPCHGSRFRPDGQVIHGPAVHPLTPHGR